MPQGSGSTTPNGDYVSTTGGGLNTFYRYFIEVPPGLSRLVVDLWDADVGLGGTGEDDPGRDRQRGGSWNTSVTYSLVNPAGTARTTQFTTGNAAGPAGADAQWLALYDSTGETFRDNFGAAAYTNNDGTLTWSTNWTETNDDNNAGAGLVQITGGELRIRDNFQTNTNASIIEREASLQGTSATFSFDVRTEGVEATDQMRVEVSGNGGGSWTTLETFTGAIAATTRSYDISSFIASNTRVRFISVNYSNNSGNDSFFVDNLQIKENRIRAGHWELRVDQSSAVTTGDDINAIGIRAHDGTSGSGGTELNVYYDSHNQFGVNPDPDANTRSYTVYPYITSGCSAFKNDFDYDSDSGNTGSLSFASRSGAGAFTQNYTSASLSIDNDWRRDSFSGWTSDTNATEYGIWSLGLTINTYGSTSGNYTNLWMSNFQAASDTPAANPTTNAFRVYLPTDAAAAPLEPYLEQQVRFTGCGLSGPNPPQVGQTSCYTVTVRFANPTPQAIRFSNSSPTDLVTAYVPGGGVVYAGGAQVSHGSIVSQPSVGGTGSITWNPGTGSPTTLAAGATAILSYRVNVTPTSAGQKLAVTGCPAAAAWCPAGAVGNGTRAQYVDATGNTTQTRATYLFGPLCELALTQGLLTQAVVSAFHASPAAGGGVLVEWTTASETGTAGFNLYRRDPASRRWVPVNGRLLAGVLEEQGGTYRFVDEEASPYESQVYRLEEIEAGRGRRIYGPFAVAVDWRRQDPRRGDRVYERDAHPASRREAEPEPSTAKGRSAAAALVRPGAGGAHLSVRQTGLYYLAAADVASWLDVTADTAGKLIAKGKLALTRDGQDVAYHPDLVAGAGKGHEGDAQGLFFYGEASTDLYGDAGVYRLQRDGRGVFMAAAAAGTVAAVPGGSFPETLHAERDALPATVISPDPESDYWFWEYLQGDDPSFGHRTFSLDAPGVVAGAGGTLAISLQGATASGVADEHQATVALNGQSLGEVRWTGIAPAQAAFPVGAGNLLAAANQVEVTAHTGGGAPYSIFYVDGFDLSYPRSFRAAGDALAFTAGGNAQVTVGGFSAAGVRLLDVQDPLRPRWIAGAAVEPDGAGGYRVSFSPAAEGLYLAAAPAAFKTPAAVRAWSASSLRSRSNRAQYLVVAPAALRDAAERLADLRRAQGLEAMVVDLDQIMDEFNAGAVSPHAIRAFLAYAYAAWSRPPRYVALAGEGTLDYRNLLGYADNLLPPLMIQTQGGLFPSDNGLGDFNDDGLPEIAVGRIPVLSAAELDAYTAKIAAYEASSAAWKAQMVMVADATDRGADFTADSERIAGQVLPPYTVDRIYLSAMPFAAARSQLLADIGSGASFVDYVGHGGLDRLSAGGLLTNADVPGLANGERLPVFTAMTCTINRFAVPGVPALGELLVKSPSGGAAAVWGPSGLSANGEARLLAERFYHAGGEARLGDRVLRAIAEFRAYGGDPSLPRVYDVLGDPALRLPVPPPAPGSGGSSEE